MGDDEKARFGALTGLITIALQETVEFSLLMPGDAALFALRDCFAPDARAQMRARAPTQ